MWGGCRKATRESDCGTLYCRVRRSALIRNLRKRGLCGGGPAGSRPLVKAQDDPYLEGIWVKIPFPQLSFEEGLLVCDQP